MSTTEEILRDIFELDVVSPFDVTIAGTIHRFQYLVKGSGPGLGMVVDKDPSKLSPVAPHLTELGYAHMCFDLDTGDFTEFSEILDNHGIEHG